MVALSLVIDEVEMHCMEIGHEGERAMNSHMRILFTQFHILFMGMSLISTEKQEMVVTHLLEGTNEAECTNWK